jgi:hypothetical protein
MSNDTAAAPSPAAEVSIEDVQQQTLKAIGDAIASNEHERAHCLAETYEALVRAQTMDHQAMRVAAERALRQLAQAREGATA